MSRIFQYSTWATSIENSNEDTSEKMKVIDANTEPIDGNDLKILDIIHSSEKPRLRFGISKLFMISRILRSFPQWVQYCNNLPRLFSIPYGFSRNTLNRPKMLHRTCCNVKGMVIPHGKNWRDLKSSTRWGLLRNPQLVKDFTIPSFFPYGITTFP